MKTMLIILVVFVVSTLFSFPFADALKSNGNYVPRITSTGTDKIVCGMMLCSDKPLTTIEKIISFISEPDEEPSEIIQIGGISQQAAIIIEEPDVAGIELHTKTTNINSKRSDVLVDFAELGENNIPSYQKLYYISIDPETSISPNEKKFSLNVKMTSPNLISSKTIEVLPPSHTDDSDLIHYSVSVEKESTNYDALQINLPNMNKLSSDCCIFTASTENLHVLISQIHESGPIQIKSVPLNDVEHFDVDVRGGLMYIPTTSISDSEILVTSDVFYVTKVSSAELNTISFGNPVIISYHVPNALADFLMSKIRLLHNNDGIWEDITIAPQILDIDYPETWDPNHVVVGITNEISEDNTFGGFVAGIPLE